MKKKLRTWLAGVRSAFPTTFSPYWRMLPLSRMKMFLAGYFFVGAAGGFALDLLQLNASRVGGGFFWPVLMGTGATALRVAAIKRVRVIPILFLLVALTAWLGYWASHVSTPLPVPVAVHRRVLFDAIGILLGIAFGIRFLLFFAGTQGVASVRMQTELSLAHGIQATLVPVEMKWSGTRAVEMTVGGRPNRGAFPQPWKSLRDSHIPTAPTTAIFSSKTYFRKESPRSLHPSPSGSSFDWKRLQNQTTIGSDPRSLEIDFQTGIERELEWLILCLTH